MGCSACSQKYGGIRSTRRLARVRYQRVGRRRTPVVVKEPTPSVTEQQQQPAPTNVTPIEVPTDPATGSFVGVIKNGGSGEFGQMTDTMPQPNPIGVEDCPKES